MEFKIKTEDPAPVQHRFGKLMLGTAAGFIATALMEALYEAVTKQPKPNQPPNV